MPELPEVETWRRLVEERGVGRTIRKAVVYEDKKVFDKNSSQTIRDKLKHLTITGTRRKGKHLWLTFDQPGHLYLHFGMTGSLRAYSEDETDPPSHRKLELHFDDGTILAYRNMRRIGKVRWLLNVEEMPPVSRLGPDPLEDDLDLNWLTAKLQAKRGTIKSALLNQKLFAGVGNWIADEVLYQARIAPQRKCSELSEKEIKTLRTCLFRVLEKSVAAGADSSKFPRTWLFHHRWGKKAERTSRDEAIRFDTVGGRTSAWVPERQK